FWTEGWYYERGSDQVKNKLHAMVTQVNEISHAAHEVHPEIIMYGRPAGGGLPLLPGWMENGANCALWNGFPINGAVSKGPDGAVTIGGASLPINRQVRVTGVINLDCGHGIGSPCYDDDADLNNVEIHPVYSIDVVQDWSRPRPNANLTGVWA